jgi:hypothetical protein
VRLCSQLSVSLACRLLMKVNKRCLLGGWCASLYVGFRGRFVAADPCLLDTVFVIGKWRTRVYLFVLYTAI